MVNINAYASSSFNPVAGLSVSSVPLSPVSPDEEDAGAASSTPRSNTSTVSILARQLSEAATRAETRDVPKDAKLLGAITGDAYFSNQAQHDAEAPKTASPELLARARQATAFVNDADSNPFKGLTRDQLSLIAHDDGGSFTANERRAAWLEMQSTAPPAARSTSASGDGRDLMISRLFGGYEPAVAYPPATTENAGQNFAEFLTDDDRALVADMYAYAKEEGADLAYVDQLARSIGAYRRCSDGRQKLSSNNGYNLEGYRVTFNFKKEDAATASRILNGTAINSTRLDQGYLRHTLNPDYGALSNIGGLPFLEKMVNKFSSEGVKHASLGDEFSAYKAISINDNIVVTTNKDIRVPPATPMNQHINGVWSLTELGKATGYKVDTATGRLHKPTDTAGDQVQKGGTFDVPTGKALEPGVVDAFATSRDQPTKRWIWPGHLFKLMKSYKP